MEGSSALLRMPVRPGLSVLHRLPGSLQGSNRPGVTDPLTAVGQVLPFS